jgi:hypothetical protein
MKSSVPQWNPLGRCSAGLFIKNLDHRNPVFSVEVYKPPLAHSYPFKEPVTDPTNGQINGISHSNNLPEHIFFPISAKQINYKMGSEDSKEKRKTSGSNIQSRKVHSSPLPRARRMDDRKTSLTLICRSRRAVGFLRTKQTEEKAPRNILFQRETSPLQSQMVTIQLMNPYRGAP